jgi:two-component system LytT family response regulator
MNAQRNAYLTVPTPEGYLFISQEEITYCESDGNYTIIYLQDQRKTICCRKLKEIAQYLWQEYFVRVHQSYIVNLGYLEKYYRKNGGRLQLVDGTIVPVSRSRKAELLERINPI